MIENIEVPSVLEDFERGDRVYWQRYSVIHFGIVSSVSAGIIVVQFDDSTYGSFTEREITTWNSREQNFGKPLDLSLIEEGSIISQMTGGKRFYAEVLSYIPKVELSYILKGSKVVIVVKEEEYGASIEEKMMDWELEG